VKNLDALKKTPPPLWSEEKWQSLEDKVIAELHAPKVHLFPFWAGAATLAAAAAIILAVLIFRSPVQNQQIAINQNLEVKKGSRFTVSESKKITAFIDRGTEFHLFESGDIEFLEHSKEVVVIKLNSGAIELEVSKREKGQTFQVVTNHAIAEVVGTRFRVEVINDGLENLTRLSVIEGIVKFCPINQPDNEMFVRAGESAVFKDGSVKPPLQTAVQHIPTSVLVDNNQQLKLMKRVIEQSSDFTTIDTTGKQIKSILLSMDYMIAQSRIKSGDFSGALAIINRLLSKDSLLSLEKVRLIQDRAMIFRQTGDLYAYADALEELSRECCDSLSADNQLWEAILIRSRDISDFSGAAASLKEYLSRFPRGQWREEALLKYAEVRYALRQIDSAVASYKNYISSYPQSTSIDRALYHLAHIESHEIGDCNSAAGHYSYIAANIPGSPLVEDATFWYADCMERVGDKKIARATYEKYLKSYPDGRWAASATARMRKGR
jgi:tetratricopeptide (TPR) repeat protein